MGYNLFIIWYNYAKVIEIGFDSKFLKIKELILALKYVHIARRSYF